MTHTRIRPFNTRDTYPEQRLDNDLAQAVIAGGKTVFLRGQVAQDLDTSETVGVGDPVAQTHRVMQNIQTLLTECGAEMADLCRIVVYLTDIRHREPVYRTADLTIASRDVPHDRIVEECLDALRARLCAKNPSDQPASDGMSVTP